MVVFTFQINFQNFPKRFKRIINQATLELAFEVTKQFIDSEEISSKEYKEICKKTYGKVLGKI